LNERVEVFESKRCFGQITSRAFAETYKTLKLTQHLLCDNGHYLLMKGVNADLRLHQVVVIHQHKA
jgi:16S rRNA (guanine527-N7)-methyltransferase